MPIRLLLNIIVLLLPLHTYSQTSMPAWYEHVKAAIVTIENVDEDGNRHPLGPGCFISGSGDVLTLEKGTDEIQTIRIINGQGHVENGVIDQPKNDNTPLLCLKVSRLDTFVQSIHPKQNPTNAGEDVFIFNAANSTLIEGTVLKCTKNSSDQLVIQIASSTDSAENGSPVISNDGELIGFLSAEHSDEAPMYTVLPATLLSEDEQENPYVSMDIPIEEQTIPADSALNREIFLGLFALTNTNYDEALTHFRNVISIDELNEDAWFQVGYCANKLNRFSEAAEAFIRYLEFCPTNAEAHYDLGVVYTHQKKYDEAIDRFKQCINIKNDYVKAYYNLAVVYIRRAEYGSAIRYFQEVLKLDAAYAEAYFGMGLSYGHLNQHKLAVEAFRRALELRPDYIEAMIGLGLIESSVPVNEAQ